MAKPKKVQLSGIEHGLLRIPGKQTARLSYSFLPSKTLQIPERIIVFLSGLDNPTTVWQKTLERFLATAEDKAIDLPPILLYDRFGVGNSDPDPTDIGKPPSEYHNCNSAVADLHSLILHILQHKYKLDTPTAVNKLRITFCAHSFGVCVGYLYAQTYPFTVENLLILDSAIAAIPAYKMIPDPDIPQEWENRTTWAGRGFPAGVTAEMCRDAIRKTKESPISGRTMATRERMRWDDMPALMPWSDRPKLRGPGAGLPLVTVDMSDSEAVVREQVKLSGLPEVMLRDVVFPKAYGYRVGQVHYQGRGVGKGPIIAKGSGHMIPLQRPDLVAGELLEMLVKSSRLIQSRM